jgi:hypothetical protein
MCLTCGCKMPERARQTGRHHLGRHRKGRQALNLSTKGAPKSLDEGATLTKK